MIFFEDLTAFPFLQYAMVAGALASVACGVMGTYVVVRRMTYMAGAIAHSVLGGMGAARYAQRVHGVEWATPLLGATVAAVLVALILAWVTQAGREREDTVLSAVWAVGMAVGFSFIQATPGYEEDLMSYLFGSILLVRPVDLWYMGILNAVILVLVVVCYDRFLLVSFQPELARLRGISVRLHHGLLLVLTALTVVLLTQVVGLVLVIALMTLPAATAGYLTRRLWSMMLVAGVLCVGVTWGGIVISYAPDLPAGATVIELAAVLYLTVMGGSRLRGWIAGRRLPGHANRETGTAP